MEQTILTPEHQTVIDAVAAEVRLDSFYLSGGTALAAFFLKHRYSDDLDFFTPRDADWSFLTSFIERLEKILDAQAVRHERLFDRRLYFFTIPRGELKIEFTIYPFEHLEEPIRERGMRIDSLRDISANKLAALVDRFDPKDFVDLFFILKQHSLADICRDAEKKFGIKLPPLLLGGEFAKVKRIEVLPKMLIPITIDELKIFFTGQAKKLGSDLLE